MTIATNKLREPAFPLKEPLNSDYPGMSLRDYFAAAALQGWLGSYGPESPHPAVDGERQLRKVAAQAYEMADAMLAEREKQ